MNEEVVFVTHKFKITYNSEDARDFAHNDMLEHRKGSNSLDEKRWHTELLDSRIGTSDMWLRDTIVDYYEEIIDNYEKIFDDQESEIFEIRKKLAEPSE